MLKCRDFVLVIRIVVAMRVFICFIDCSSQNPSTQSIALERRITLVTVRAKIITGAPVIIFALTVTSVILLSNAIDWVLGFWDEQSIKQIKTRMATTMRITKTKSLHFSICYEIYLLMKQALPIWIAGIAALTFYLVQSENLWLATFTLITLSNIVFQRAFSRYHYLPWFALLSLGCGLGMDWLMQQEITLATTITSVFFVIFVWNIKSLFFYYSKPTNPETLAQYEKYDQYLYIPRLGKILKRLMRMRGESGERIFVWGTCAQI